MSNFLRLIYVVAIIFPNHKLVEMEATDDYLSSLIVVDASVLSDPMLQIINQFRYRFESLPAVKLDKCEYSMIIHVLAVMRETSNLNLPDLRTMLVRQLEFLLRLLSYYRSQRLNETYDYNRISSRFHNDLAKHFRQHRDVGFYAQQACLSAKHFSTVVKEETGHTAAHWIHTQVVAEAKMLLHMRRDLTVRVIADMLGFDEQATFSRYFKRETGIFPTDYRNQE